VPCIRYTYRREKRKKKAPERTIYLPFAEKGEVEMCSEAERRLEIVEKFGNWIYGLKRGEALRETISRSKGRELLSKYTPLIRGIRK